MHKKLILAVVLGAAIAVYHKGHQQAILTRFPDLDPRTARSAYNTVLRGALTGRLPQDADNDQLDRLFLDEYNKRSLDPN